jgi:hypothetical protein
MLHEIFRNQINAIQGKPMQFDNHYKDHNYYENEALMDSQDNLFDTLTDDQSDSAPILHAYRKYFDYELSNGNRPKDIHDWAMQVDSCELIEAVNEWFKLNKGQKI